MSGLKRTAHSIEACTRMREDTRVFRLPASGQEVRYHLRKSRRARHMRMEIRPHNGLTVVLPHFVPEKQAETFLAEKERWILKHLNTAAPPVSEQTSLGEGSLVPYKGVPHRIVLRPYSRAYFSVQLNNHTFEIQTPENEEAPVSQILESWFRWQAKSQIPQLVRSLARQFGLKPGRISIRDQKTRWGSCSSKGNLNFNWRLLMAPTAVLRYVIIHELTHLNELNHSKKFWALVAERCPEFRRHEIWLKEHGNDLRRF